jgi:membrane-bound ClpP family serine protease
MLIFVSIFAVGFVILLLSMIFGHDGNVGADADADGMDHGPNIFSVKMLSLILVGFGAGGFGLRASTEASMFVSSMAGVGGSVIVGAFGYFILRTFYRSQASSTIVDQDIVGCEGNLIDGIAQDGRGQISCIIRGREITFLARSRDGSPIKRGAAVKIVGKTASVVTVEPLE